MYLYICLGHLYNFPGLVYLLVLRGRRTYGPRLVRIVLQFQLGEIFELAFVERVLQEMGARLDTRKEPQTTREPWEVSLHSVCGGVLLLVVCA